MRFEEKPVCKECQQFKLGCKDAKRCEPIRKELRSYGGIRHTADGFDCALPVTVDSDSTCAYECLYCFSDNLTGHARHNGEEGGECRPGIGQTPISKVEAIFNGTGGKDAELTRKALRYDKRNKAGYPCAIQLGGLCDAGDTIEMNQGWLLKFLDLAVKYNQPVRMSTKGGIFLLDEYLDKIKQNPKIFWVAFSIICFDDDLIQRVDRGAPATSVRLAAMKRLSQAGARTSLRLRPIMKGITDRNHDYKRLIHAAAEAGAKAISYEVGFYPMGIPKDRKWKWNELAKICGYDIKKQYSSFGPIQSCTRPAYTWTESIMHSIKEEALKCGMTVGVSDPVWKQLSDVGCCCGIRHDDEVFGNWEPENATNMLILSKQDGRRIFLKDIVPPWAYEMQYQKMVNLGVGPMAMAKKTRIKTWADFLKEIWNDTGRQRSPMNYFQGALQLDGKDDEGNLVYKYKGLERKFIKTTWDTGEGK